MTRVFDRERQPSKTLPQRLLESPIVGGIITRRLQGSEVSHLGENWQRYILCHSRVFRGAIRILVGRILDKEKLSRGYAVEEPENFSALENLVREKPRARVLLIGCNHNGHVDTMLIERALREKGIKHEVHAVAGTKILGDWRSAFTFLTIPLKRIIPVIPMTEMRQAVQKLGKEEVRCLLQESDQQFGEVLAQDDSAVLIYPISTRNRNPSKEPLPDYTAGLLGSSVADFLTRAIASTGEEVYVVPILVKGTEKRMIIDEHGRDKIGDLSAPLKIRLGRIIRVTVGTEKSIGQSILDQTYQWAKTHEEWLRS